MRLSEEIEVTCNNDNKLGFNIGQAYYISYLEYGTDGNYSFIHLVDEEVSENEAVKLSVNDFKNIFEVPFSFEGEVIDPLLNLIKDEQDYLTKTENLPQLAKLGYIYDLLWDAGRNAWGYDGVLGGKKGYDCEDNPKYKIDMCKPKNDKIENLIYDAWGMHVSNEGSTITYDEFIKVLFDEKELSDFEKRELKTNKTFEEWVDVLTDEQYKYKSIYPNRRAVANHLLCCIGNGYGMNSEGFVISQAGGADQDKSLYGNWENAKFSDDIYKIVNGIVSLPVVKETINASVEKVNEYLTKFDKEEKVRLKMFIGKEITQHEFDTMKSRKLWDKIFSSDRMKKLLKIAVNRLNGVDDDNVDVEPYNTYYPICNYSIIDIMINPNSLKREGIKEVHQSYIDAGIEICKEILEHEEEELKKNNDNVEFAKKFLAVQGIEEYKEFIPVEVDMDSVVKEINETFSKVENYKLTLNDSRVNNYADDNCNLYIDVKPDEKLPEGIANNIEYLVNTELYKLLKPALETVENMEHVHQVFFYYKNTSKFQIHVQIITNKKYVNNDKVKSENDFISNGFHIGDNEMMKPLNGELMMVTGKSDTLGSTHPNNKNGKEYFSKAKGFHIVDSNWVELFHFHIDERGFNTFYPISNKSIKGFIIEETPTDVNKFRDSIVDEYYKMKASDSTYGKYDNKTRKGKEGRSLYAFEFMNWLEKNFNGAV